MEQTNGTGPLRLSEESGMKVMSRNFCQFQNQVDSPLAFGVGA